MGPFFVTKDVYCFKSRLWQVNTTVLTNQLATVVVDPAYFPDEIEEVIDFLGEHHCRAGYIILTHSDFDHVAGWQELKAPVIYAGKGYGQSDHRAQLQKMEETDREKGIVRPSYSYPEKVVEAEETVLPAREGNLLLYHAPGHSADSLVIIWPERELIIAGDMLSDLEFPLVYYSGELYRKTLAMIAAKVEQFNLRYLIPGHGTITRSRREIEERLQWDREYLEGLWQQTEDLLLQGLREREIFAVLKDYPYRGKPLLPDFLPYHFHNIRVLCRELTGVGN